MSLSKSQARNNKPDLPAGPAPAWRQHVLVGLMVLGFAALALRAFELQVRDRDFLLAEGERRHVRTLLDKHPDIIGIYNVGGASDGIGRALVESGRARDVTFVGHGLTPDTRAMLQDGTMDVVITQSPTVLFETALRAACEDTDHAVAMELYLSENLPMA